MLRLLALVDPLKHLGDVALPFATLYKFYTLLARLVAQSTKWKEKTESRRIVQKIEIKD